MSLLLSQARLRRTASVAALAPLLLGARGAAQESGHALIWSLFADAPDRRRDFLWRETAPGSFLILSERTPEDRHAIFELDPPKPFAPALSVGDRLVFTLRANPVVRRSRKSPDAPGKLSARHDVVMDALRATPAGDRGAARAQAITEAGTGWLGRQSTKAGFEIVEGMLRVDGYQRHFVPRRGTNAPLKFASVDFDGILTVRDPACLIAAIAAGFGAAKAFGCGLMLLRRA